MRSEKSEGNIQIKAVKREKELDVQEERQACAVRTQVLEKIQRRKQNGSGAKHQFKRTSFISFFITLTWIY